MTRLSLLRHNLRSVALSSALLGACVERPLEEVVWECIADHQCGDGLSCRAGVCAEADGPLAAGRACVAHLDTAQRDIRFGMVPSADGLMLEVFVEGREVRYALPDEVVGLAGDGIESCCESPCCE